MDVEDRRAAGRRAPAGPLQQGVDRGPPGPSTQTSSHRHRAAAPGQPGGVRTTVAVRRVADRPVARGRGPQVPDRRRPAGRSHRSTVPVGGSTRSARRAAEVVAGTARCAPRRSCATSSAEPSGYQLGVQTSPGRSSASSAARAGGDVPDQRLPRPRRWWPTSSRGSPATGAKPSASRPSPVPSHSSATGDAVRRPGSTRSAGCMASPCSVCSTRPACRRRGQVADAGRLAVPVDLRRARRPDADQVDRGAVSSSVDGRRPPTPSRPSARPAGYAGVRPGRVSAASSGPARTAGGARRRTRRRRCRRTTRSTRRPGRGRLGRAVGAVGGLRCAPAAVPGVQLEDAVALDTNERAVRGVLGPVRQADPAGPEPLLPVGSRRTRWGVVDWSGTRKAWHTPAGLTVIHPSSEPSWEARSGRAAASRPDRRRT